MTALNQALNQIEAALETCLIKDRFAIKRKLRDLREAAKLKKPVERIRQEIDAKVAASQAQYQARLLALPKPEFPEELPINARKDEIAAAIARHQVIIVCGETGSGKTTQLPKICLELGRGMTGLIGHTQPRRIAARSVASRIAQELKSTLGQVVGDATDPGTVHPKAGGLFAA